MIPINIKKVKRYLILFCLSIGWALPVLGESSYTVRKVQVEGNTTVDRNLLISLSGLQEGTTLHPSSGQMRDSIRKIAKLDCIKSVAIYLADVDETNALATYVIRVEEHPQLANYLIEGVTKKEQKSLFEKITIQHNAALSPLFLHKTISSIKKYFLDKGFRNVQVWANLTPNKEIEGKFTLILKVNKGEKSIVNKIIFEGNDRLDASLLIYNMKELNEAPRFTLLKDAISKTITLKPIRKGGILLQLPKTMDEVMYYFSKHVSFFPSLFTQAHYLKAKENLISFYQSKGFRDMRIVEERLQHCASGKLNIYLKIEEGQQYTIRHIKWVGNYLYSDQKLNGLLNLKEGNLYDPTYIKSRLNPGMTDQTIADLYTNNGYLFFRAEAVETGIQDNQVDLEIRIQEGKLATINQVNIVGNTITHDYVIRRELLTLPGEKFNRSLVLGSLRNLAMLSLFKPEKLVPDIQPDESKGTADLTYSVVEQPKFDIHLGGSFSNGLVIKLTLGSNNVSIKNLFTGKTPLGAAQQLHLTGTLLKDYKDFKLSFQEPWLWLKGNPYIFSFSLHSSYQVTENPISTTQDHLLNTMIFPLGALQHNTSRTRAIGGRIALGKKFAKYWESHWGTSYHHYAYKYNELLADRIKRSGSLHDINLDFLLTYNSTNDLNYPTSGCSWSNFLTITPPYALLGYTKPNQSTIPRFKEFGKLMIDVSFFQRLLGNFVLNLRGHTGLLHSLSKKEVGPFERFYLGGTPKPDSAESNGLLGADFIPLRGYPDDSLTPKDSKRSIKGGILFNKFVSELRYPVLLSPACVYLLGFVEMGDNWLNYANYNLLTMKKSIGGGIRVILPIPIVPMLGLDFGYRLDPVMDVKDRSNALECHFTFGSQIR